MVADVMSDEATMLVVVVMVSLSLDLGCCLGEWKLWWIRGVGKLCKVGVKCK
jgi:hypothetical protein